MKIKLLQILCFFLYIIANNTLSNNNTLFILLESKDSKFSEILKNQNEIPLLFCIDSSFLSNIIENQPQNLVFKIEMPNNNTWNVILYKHNVFSKDAKVMLNENSLLKEFDFRKGIVSYRGYIEHNKNLKVNITFSRNIINGIISDIRNTWVIGNYDHNSALAVLFKINNIKDPPQMICHNTDNDISAEAYKVMSETVDDFVKNKKEILLNNKPLSIELAIETDYLTYKFFQSDENALTSYIISLISVVSQIYERDVNASMSVKYINIWKTQDPYPEKPGDCKFLLKAAQNYWEENKKNIDKDVVMYLSARDINLGGEAASIGGVCKGIKSFAYNTIKGFFKQLPAYSWDVAITAHEFGHVFGSSHTHSCLWPIGALDSCSLPESGNCFSDVVPTEGTIMSYCTNAGGSEKLVFHPLCASVIRAFLERSNCIGTPSDSDKIYTISGKVFLNGIPIPNIDLKIEPIDFELWTGTLKPGGDSITTTDSLGNYYFSKLATGIYIVKPVKDYILLPVDDQKEVGSVIIPSRNVIHDLNIARIRTLSGKVEFLEGIVTDSISYLLVMIDPNMYKYPINKFTSKRDTFSIIAIEGNYVLIPNLKGFNFTPPFAHISLFNNDTSDVLFTAKKWKYCGIWGYTNYRRNNLINEPLPFASIKIIDKATDSIYQTILTDRKGFFSISDIPNKELIIEICNYDTTKSIPSNNKSIIIDSVTKITSSPLNFTLRDRKLPAFTNNYIFSSFNGIYNDINEFGEIIGLGRQIKTNYRIGLPFKFLFGYKYYDSINIYRGYISFGDSDPVTTTPISTNIIDEGVVSILSEYECLFVRDNYWEDTTKKSRIETHTEGIEPNRIFTIQWSNIFSTNYINKLTGFYNYQIKLFEKNQSIEFIYGECKLDSALWSLKLELGLRGSDNNDFNNRFIDSKNTWSNSVKGMNCNDFSELTTTNYPEKGLTFRWSNSTLDIKYPNFNTLFNLKVYPTVASDNIIIEFNHLNYSFVTIEIINSLGEIISVVYKGYLDSDKYNFNFNINHLGQGAYFCRIIDEKCFPTSAGFIKSY